MWLVTNWCLVSSVRFILYIDNPMATAYWVVTSTGLGDFLLGRPVMALALMILLALHRPADLSFGGWGVRLGVTGCSDPFLMQRGHGVF